MCQQRKMYILVIAEMFLDRKKKDVGVTSLDDGKL